MAIACPEELARLRPRLMAYALPRARSRDHAEDAVQEAMLAAFEGLDAFAGQSSLATWVFGILKHKLVDAARRAPREPAQEHDLDDYAYEGLGPEQACASRVALRQLDLSLARLPGKSAEAFILCEVLGLDTPEACRALGVTPAHCWVLVHRARKRLRACPVVGRLAAEAH
jgi:RNA polymerase sigma-70 factor (ECF subfamily)